MKTRLDRFLDHASHPMLKNQLAQLDKNERALCVEFIISTENLDVHEFALKVNRWMLDTQNKPKRHTTMWALVSQSNHPITKETK